MLRDQSIICFGGEDWWYHHPHSKNHLMRRFARVAWTGKSGEESGFGIEWRARDAGGGRRIRELVRRLTARQSANNQERAGLA